MLQRIENDGRGNHKRLASAIIGFYQLAAAVSSETHHVQTVVGMTPQQWREVYTNNPNPNPDELRRYGMRGITFTAFTHDHLEGLPTLRDVFRVLGLHKRNPKMPIPVELLHESRFVVWAVDPYPQIDELGIQLRIPNPASSVPGSLSFGLYENQGGGNVCFFPQSLAQIVPHGDVGISTEGNEVLRRYNTMLRYPQSNFAANFLNEGFTWMTRQLNQKQITTQL